MRISRFDDERTHAAHFIMQEANGVVIAIVGTEGVGADEFGAVAGLMCFGFAHRAHFMQRDDNAGFRQLPCRLAAC